MYLLTLMGITVLCTVLSYITLKILNLVFKLIMLRIAKIKNIERGKTISE